MGGPISSYIMSGNKELVFPLRFHGVEAQVIMVLWGMGKGGFYLKICCLHQDSPPIVLPCAMILNKLFMLGHTCWFLSKSPLSFMLLALATGLGMDLQVTLVKFRVNPRMFARITRKGSSISEGLETGRL